MKAAEPPLLTCRQPNQGYDRLLRRLDQALDIANTRQWLGGEQRPPPELEVQGLSAEDLALLQQVLRWLGNCSGGSSTAYQAEQQYACEQACQWPGAPT